MSALCLLFIFVPMFLSPDLLAFYIERGTIYFGSQVLLILIFLLAYLVCFSAFIFRLGMFVRDENGGVLRALMAGIRRLPCVLFTTIIFSIVMFIAFLLLIVPGIICSVFLYMYLPLVIWDNEGPIEAFKHSIELVSGNWWHTFVVLWLIPTLAFVIAAYFIDILSFDVWPVPHLLGGGIGVFDFLARLVFAFFGVPLLLSLVFVLFNDLKLRKGEKDGASSIIEHAHS